MKKILTMLLIVATVTGMAVPAIANPQNEPIAVATNIKGIFMEVDGAIPTNNNVVQGLANTGGLSNWAMGIAEGGNADATSANVGAANSGATSGVAASNDSMGDSEAYASDNLATVEQYSNAYAYGGSPEGFGGRCSNFDTIISICSGGLDQSNDVSQDSEAYVYNDQDLDQYPTVTEYQESYADAPGTQVIEDSMFNEDGWVKVVDKDIN